LNLLLAFIYHEALLSLHKILFFSARLYNSSNWDT